MFKTMLTAASAFLCATALQSYAAELKDFPKDTHWILSVDVKAAQASPAMKFIVNKIDPAKRQDAQTKLAALKAVFGVDLIKDIDHLVLAGNGDAAKGGVAYIYGTFDQQRLTTILAASKDFASVDRNGATVLSWTDDKDNKPKCMSFAHPGLVMMSDRRDILCDALDVLSGSKPGLDASSPLAPAVVRNDQNLLTLGACGIPAIVGTSPKAEALKQAEALSLCIRATDAENIDADLSVTATNDATALQVQQALLGIQAIALLRANEAPEAATFAQQAKIACKGRTVSVSLNLPKSLIENAVKARQARQADAAAAAPQTTEATKPANAAGAPAAGL